MADAAKYAPINGENLFIELKPHFSIVKTQRTKVCVYACVFVFIAFTIFLAFSPSPASSSPWFTNVFSLTSGGDDDGGGGGGGSVSTPTSIFSDASNRSQFSSIFSYFFPNPSQQAHNFTATPPPYNAPAPSQSNSSEIPSKNQTLGNDKVEVLNSSGMPSKNQTLGSDKVEVLNSSEMPSKNQTLGNDKVEVLNSSEMPSKNQTLGSDKVEVLKPSNQNTTVNNQTQDKVGLLNSDLSSNLSSIDGHKSPESKNVGGKGENKIAEKDELVKNGSEDLIKSLMNCDLFDGNWVKDESYPLYKPGSCSLIDEQFNCFLNGRPDNDYYKYKWKPKACTLPRLNATHMLEILRGKRLVFVGDSLNRNMWESLVCILKNSVKDQKKVYEKSGRQSFRGEASYSFVFEDYNCTVEFFVAPFLVQEWEVSDKKGQKKETLRLDLVAHSAGKYKNADIIVFNTGHWWTHEKTSKGEDYYQEGNHVYHELNVLEAFRKALTTWGRWVDSHINPAKTFVLFRGYSASHFSGGQWNSGGACDHEVEPIKNETYLTPYPPKMEVLEKILKGMKTPVSYLNVTRITDFRKDGHPSMYRKQKLSDEERRSPLRYQDCSHWCLPGVPDYWNELLYAEILVNQYQKQQK